MPRITPTFPTAKSSFVQQLSRHGRHNHQVGIMMLVPTSAQHQLRHAHAVEMSREGVPLVVIQRQLGHADLGITSSYLRGIDNTEIIHAVHERPAPMIPATTGLSPAA